VSGFRSILIPAREVEPIVAPLREDGDWSSRHGVPAHLTIAGPWPLEVDLPLQALGGTRDAMRGERYLFGSVGALGDAICLFPRDDAPLLHWRARILEIVGVRDQVDENWRIHLTISRAGSLREAQASIARALPVTCVVDDLLLAEMQDGALTRLQPL
jgi:hypothetical protein